MHAQLAAIEENPRAVLGGNLPPHLKAFEAHQTNIDDLYEEAKNWLDGSPIETQAQHDEVERLLDMIRDAETAADESRIAENKPFDDGKAEVQARYAPLIADNKSIKGKTTRAKAACLVALTAWRQKVDEEKRQEAARLREIADAQAEEAAAAIRAVQGSSDLGAREEAEALLVSAVETGRAATRLEASKTGLRARWVPTLTDPVAALKHYRATRPDALKAFLLEQAWIDVRASIRTIPGFTVTPEKRAT